MGSANGRAESPAQTGPWVGTKGTNPIPGLPSLAVTGPGDEPDPAFVVVRKECSMFPIGATVEPS